MVSRKAAIKTFVYDFFAGALSTNDSGDLLFDYSSGEREHYSSNFHRIPISQGYWSSKTDGLNLVRFIFISESAIQSLSFYDRNAYKYPKTEQLLFISIGCTSRFPTALIALCKGKKVSFLFSSDILDIITQVKLCFFLKSRKIFITISNEMVFCSYNEKFLSAMQPKITLRLLLNYFQLRSEYCTNRHSPSTRIELVK